MQIYFFCSKEFLHWFNSRGKQYPNICLFNSQFVHNFKIDRCRVGLVAIYYIYVCQFWLGTPIIFILEIGWNRCTRGFNRTNPLSHRIIYCLIDGVLQIYGFRVWCKMENSNVLTPDSGLNSDIEARFNVFCKILCLLFIIGYEFCFVFC